MGNEEDVAFRHLIHEKTHRIPRGSHNSIKTALSLLYRRVFLDILHKKSNPEIIEGDTCFYNENIENWCLAYINKNGPKRQLAISLTPYNVHLGGNLIVRMLYLACIGITMLCSIPLITIRPVTIWALHITVLHEHFRIMSLVKKGRVKYFYDFISYEIGSSFLNILLMQNNIRSYCITSPTPLYETYPDYVADVFLSTSPYHQEELEHKANHPKYPLRFFYRELQLWPYNEFDDNLELNNEKNTNKKILGLYVSGVWWRNKEKHQEYANGFFESEFLLLDQIRQFLLKHPEFRMKLFLHPKEKQTPELLTEAKDFYNQKFEGLSFEYGDLNKPTKAQFASCNISISVSSNTTYERLYGGFKSIFTPYYLPNFPIPSSKLNAICAKSYETLENKILEVDTLSDDAFFEIFQLKQYHHRYAQYDCFINSTDSGNKNELN